MRRVVAAVPLLLAGCVIYDEYHVIPAREPVSSLDALTMTKAGVPDDAILAKIYSNGVNRNPNTDDIVMMKGHGVSDVVIRALIEAPVMTPRPERVVSRRTWYHDHVSEGVFYFGLGAMFGRWWGHGWHHRHGCRW